ncbi:hypothetical protein D6T65_11715 [Arthrobacter frigidicola]|nr:hypothetical protein D6T65_11715 [Arthrobacter frigidicola]
MLMHSVESREEFAVSGFVELMCLEDDFLDAEFQEIVERIDPPARVRGIAAPARRRRRGTEPARGRHRPRLLRQHGSRTPPPARERSPPTVQHRKRCPTRQVSGPFTRPPILDSRPAVPPMIKQS